MAWIVAFGLADGEALAHASFDYCLQVGVAFAGGDLLSEQADGPLDAADNSYCSP